MLNLFRAGVQTSANFDRTLRVKQVISSKLKNGFSCLGSGVFRASFVSGHEKVLKGSSLNNLFLSNSFFIFAVICITFQGTKLCSSVYDKYIYFFNHLV